MAAPPAPERWKRRLALAGCAVLAAIPLTCAIGSIVVESTQRVHPKVDGWVDGARVQLLDPAAFAPLAPRVQWAWSAPRASSARYDLDRPSLLAPQVWPRHASSDDDAWSPYHDDDGLAWVSAEWSSPVPARRLVVLETFHPGAVVELHDVTDEIPQPMLLARRIGLWRGRTPRVASARALVVTLAEPRWLQRVRVVLDTSLAPGRNDLDAVGVLTD